MRLLERWNEGVGLKLSAVPAPATTDSPWRPVPEPSGVRPSSFFPVPYRQPLKLGYETWEFGSCASVRTTKRV